jgi:hypothetical protein
MAIKLGALGDKMRVPALGRRESRLPTCGAERRAPPCNEVLREIKKRQEILSGCLCGCGDPSERTVGTCLSAQRVGGRTDAAKALSPSFQ